MSNDLVQSVRNYIAKCSLTGHKFNQQEIADEFNVSLQEVDNVLSEIYSIVEDDSTDNSVDNDNDDRDKLKPENMNRPQLIHANQVLESQIAELKGSQKVD